MKSLAGKTVLITGGAGGIARGMARAFARQGARILLADIDTDRLAEAHAEIAAPGAAVATDRLDVTDLADWQRLIEAAPAAIGPIDVLCNNAGIGSEMQDVAGHDPDQWRRVIEVNLIGYFLGCRSVLPQLIARGGEGHIVNIASLSGLRANPAMSAYGASKHGVVGLSDALRAELDNTPIGVSIVYPGMTRTNFIANSRHVLGMPQGAAESGGDKLDDTIATMLAQSMHPDKLGERIVRAVLDREYHVFTHIGARPQIAAIFEERLAAFRENADPDYVDDVAALETAIAANAGSQ